MYYPTTEAPNLAEHPGVYVAKLRLLGVAFVFLWFMLGGIAHFTSTAFFTAIVPPYIPFPVAAVYISGVIEVLAAAALLLPSSRRVAGAVLFALTIAVTPANVHMWLNPELFPMCRNYFYPCAWSFR